MLPCYLTDGYKISHPDQEPDGISLVYSNFTPRKSRLSGINRVVVFGLQYFIKRYLQEEFGENFFRLSLPEISKELNEYELTIDNYVGGGKRSAQRWFDLYQVGYLPLEIKGLPEGSLCPMKVPVLTVKNTHPQFAWLTNWVETLLSNTLWHPMTCATIAREYRLLLDKYALATSDDQDGVSYQAHDFSMRGQTSIDSAASAGAAHLLNFRGSDSVPAIKFLEKYYKANNSDVIAKTVPASEHAIMTKLGREGEYSIFERLLTNVYPDGIVSIVSDSYDYWNVLTNYMKSLRNTILERDGKLIIRGDCYDEQTQILTPNGWKFFKDLTDNDLVAQVNQDHTYSFVKPIERIEFDYSGRMYRFHDHHGKVDLLVTPNHRMVYSKCNNLLVEEAESIKIYGDKKLLRAVEAKNKTLSLTWFERLQIAFQADGSFPSKIPLNEGQLSGNKCIRFTFTKQRKIDRLIWICENGKFKYTVSNEPARLNQKVIYVWFDKSLKVSKKFDWVDISNLCSNWSKEFIDELSEWDSSKRNLCKIEYSTTIKYNYNIVEIIALSAGYGCFFGERVDNRKPHFSTSYRASILKYNVVDGQSVKKDSIDFIGKVYSVKVESGMILVKRNKCTLVSGNSGDPVKIACGDPDASSEVEKKGTIQLLWDIFGGSTNSKGYIQLNPHIGFIYGDSITLERCEAICKGLRKNGFASTNITFGIGSYTYQYLTRDTFGLAMKATAAEINGDLVEIYKDPVTDDGTKRSAKGLLRVYPELTYELCPGGKYFTYKYGDYKLFEQQTWEQEQTGCLETVFLNGVLTREQDLADIRWRLAVTR